MVKLLPYALVVTAILAVMYFIYSTGVDDALEDVRNDNQEAGDKADIWRGHMRDCARTGQLYDFRTGKCSRP